MLIGIGISTYDIRGVPGNPSGVNGRCSVAISYRRAETGVLAVFLRETNPTSTHDIRAVPGDPSSGCIKCDVAISYRRAET